MAKRLRFGTHLIDPAARELSEEGRLLQVSPRVFDCLAYLIEHHDRAVGRDELMAAVWGKADVADTQLMQVILKARRAIGDSGESQHAIRTIAGFGYRWVADIVSAPSDSQDIRPEAALTPPETDPQDHAAPDAPALPATAPLTDTRGGARARLSTSLVVLAVAAIAVTVWMAVLATRTERAGNVAASATTTAATPNSTIAVLPAVVDANGEWDWLRLGVMELVAGRLRSAGRTVAPSENVVSLLRTTEVARLPDAVASVLGPRWLVITRLRKADAGWIVELELRDANARTRVLTGRADDAVSAARVASDSLLAALGSVSAQDGDAASRTTEVLLSRIDAALLVDDLESARKLFRSAPDSVRHTPELRLRGAEITFTAGQNEEAADALVSLRDVVRAETDPVLRARIDSLLGAARVRLGQPEAAEHDLGDALGLLESRNEPALLGKAYMRRGAARVMQARHDEALADFSRARVALQLAGDTLGLAQVELNEGALNGERNHPADALASFQRAESIFERFGVGSEIANAQANQIVANGVLLEHTAALAVSERSLALLGRLASVESSHLLRVRRAQALAEIGRLGEARAQLDELARVLIPEREPQLAAIVATERARFALQQGDAGLAGAMVSPVVASLADSPFDSTRSEAWLVAIRALRANAQTVEAREASREYSSWAAATRDETLIIHATLAAAEQAVADNDMKAGDERFEQALSAAHRANTPAHIVEVATSWVTTLVARDELFRASAVAGQVARFAPRDFNAALLQVRLYHALGQYEAWRDALATANALAGERAVPDEFGRAPAAVSAN